MIEITEETFAQHNAGEIILDLVRKGAKIPKEHWQKVLDLQEKYKIIYEAIQKLPVVKSYGRMYDQEYILKGYTLPDDDLFEIACWRNFEAAMILLEYVQKGYHLPNDVLLKIADWRNCEAIEILLEYGKKYDFSYRALFKIADGQMLIVVATLYEYLQGDHAYALRKEVLRKIADSYGLSR